MGGVCFKPELWWDFLVGAVTFIPDGVGVQPTHHFLDHKVS